MQRHMNKKHSNSNFSPVIPMSQEKCQRFQLVRPFTCMVAGMTGSGKTVWVLFTVAKRLHAIEFVKGIPESLENDSHSDGNLRNLVVIDDQMIEAEKIKDRITEI